jgi:alpha-galactosidase
MLRLRVFFAALVLCAFIAVAGTGLAFETWAQSVAPRPPLGWNSWDAYGLTIDEADFRANVKVLAGLKQYGWLYAVVDEGWYMQDPFADKVETRKYVWDANGNLIPAVGRFPSAANGAGFKPLADSVHKLGLKFGIHIVRGIPRQVVKENLPIAGTSLHAQDAADLDATCPWDEGNYGVSDTPAGQAYYDGMLKLYASWGLDFIKVDCISDHPYRPTEIRQIAEAIRKTGRPIVLSLSPGPTALEHAAEVAKYSQLWRITDDHWDEWAPKRNAGSEYPFGLKEEFDRIAKWAPYVKPGSWPDPDMLPEGSLKPHPGAGEPRQSRYTHDEQRTEFTLWAISRSPLIFGGNLTQMDDFTRSLLTNTEVLGVNQTASESHPMTNLPAGLEPVRVWVASKAAYTNLPVYCALFNLDDQPVTVHFTWEELGFRARKQSHDRFSGAKVEAWKPVTLTLPAHASAIYRVE